jgi:hypothetical protein
MADVILAFVPLESECDCGHAATFHDAYGCAAFLGGFWETRDQKRYCQCRARRSRRAIERDIHFDPLEMALEMISHHDGPTKVPATSAPNACDVAQPEAEG